MTKRDDALQQVKMFQSNDWELVEETPEYFLLKRNTATGLGHFVVFLFTWWTLGLCNLIYWAVNNKTRKVVI